MKKIMLANSDYKTHMTDEGDQLQRGMEYAGWHLCGAGYDNLRHVPTILGRYDPDVVFIHDKRDWDMGSGGCFKPGIDFQELHALKDTPTFRLGVVKDAGTLVEYHRQFIEQIGASAVVTYYHDNATKFLSPWLANYKTIRTYHSIDAEFCRANFTPRFRMRLDAIVSGAVSNTYPLRQIIINNAREIGCEVLRHPGYNNRGSHTENYLKIISGYRVSLATASSYKFALRKIIEAVAMGAVPITDLPAWDVLPEIDGALVRVLPNIAVSELRDIVQHYSKTWDLDERRDWARKAWAFYDWPNMGRRLDRLIGVAAGFVQEYTNG